MFAPIPSEPCIELSIRYCSEVDRLFPQCGESVTHAIITCGVYAYVNPSCCEIRSNGSVSSDGQTSSVYCRIPRSTRPPPPEHDSISTFGCRFFSSPSTQYKFSMNATYTFFCSAGGS